MMDNFNNISFGMNYNLTEEEWECVRVCVSNAPIPYDITLKKIPGDILAKIGEPKPRKGKPLSKAKYDLSQYGIHDE